jgi:hypothetical protein
VEALSQRRPTYLAGSRVADRYDRPNIFGTVALAVSRSLLDYRWQG